MSRIPTTGDLVQIRGEDCRIWSVSWVGITLGHHDRVARLVVPPGVETWDRSERVVPLRMLTCCPPDLEDFPCSPV